MGVSGLDGVGRMQGRLGTVVHNVFTGRLMKCDGALMQSLRGIGLDVRNSRLAVTNAAALQTFAADVQTGRRATLRLR